MHVRKLIFITAACGLLAGCAMTGDHRAAAPGTEAPAGWVKVSEGPGHGPSPSSDMVTFRATGPTVVNASALPPKPPQLTGPPRPETEHHIEMPISEEEAERLRAEALLAPPQPERFRRNLTRAVEPTVESGFDSQDFPHGGWVPPDPEVAVGRDHIIVVVNTTVEVFDKTGASLVGPTDLDGFLGCAGTFDPNVIYDEAADRFMVGADGNGSRYCFAVSETGDATQNWYQYNFRTDVNGAFFDYPHAGVGRDAIYMGANMFGVPEDSRVWAFDKTAAYGGAAPTVVTHTTGSEFAPQPANLHGQNDGTWPTTGPHYIMTDSYDGAHYTVWAWTDPFGTDTFVQAGTVDLEAATGVNAVFAVNGRQAGSNRRIQANDWRGLDTEYRNGSLWVTHTIGCNPGAGTVDCVRWAQIDPLGPTVIQAGVLATDGDYRLFPDLAVDRCENVIVGYTLTNTAIFPSIAVAARESTDPAGSLTTETVLKDGEVSYNAYDGSPHRWGDYTAMTIDPDGVTFWYVGEYSKDLGGAQALWGTYVSAMTLPCEITECGNFTIDSGEDCDDGGVDTADCDRDCTRPACGDGIFNPFAEQCDEGGVNTPTCDFDCTLPECGDGIFNPFAEQCDEGGMNTPTCDRDCTLPECGDGLWNWFLEQCDTGMETAYCDDDCTLPECGDNNLNEAAGEECDDGNTEPGDGCDAECHLEPDCTAGRLSPIAGLIAFKEGAAGIQFVWEPDPLPGVVEYHVNSVDVKTQLIDPRRNPPGFGSPKCVAAAPDTTCIDNDALSDPARILFFETLSACGSDGVQEGP